VECAGGACVRALWCRVSELLGDCGTRVGVGTEGGGICIVEAMMDFLLVYWDAHVLTLTSRYREVSKSASSS
jgi:hypothetical protein